MLTDNDLTIQVHPSPSQEVTLPEERSFTLAEVEEKLQQAYALGHNAAMDKVREPIRLLMELNHQLIGMQQSTIEMMKGSYYDYW